MNSGAYRALPNKERGRRGIRGSWDLKTSTAGFQSWQVAPGSAHQCAFLRPLLPSHCQTVALGDVERDIVQASSTLHTANRLAISLPSGSSLCHALSVEITSVSCGGLEDWVHW
jgi:hypothetical protein